MHIALHTDHCPKDKLDGFVRPLLAASTERVQGRRHALVPVAHVGRLGGAAGGEPRDRPRAARPGQGRRRHPGDRGGRGRRRGGRRRGRRRREALLHARGRARHRRGAGARRERPLPHGPDLRQRARRLQAGQRQAPPRDPQAGAGGGRQGQGPRGRRQAVRPGLPRRVRLAGRGDLRGRRLRRGQDERRHRHPVRLHPPGRRLHVHQLRRRPEGRRRRRQQEAYDPRAWGKAAEDGHGRTGRRGLRAPAQRRARTS